MSPNARNPNHQNLVALYEPEFAKAVKPLPFCDCTLEKYGKVSAIIPRSNCAACDGSDDIGQSFCPVCEYCCGC